MADSTPSRPAPTRKMTDGVVEGAPAAAVEKTVESPVKTITVQIGVNQLGQPITRERPIPQRVPEVGSYNSRGAQVEQAFITPKAILRVDLK